MAIERVQTPQAANLRAIKRLERQEQQIEREFQRRDKRLFDERMRKARSERIAAQQRRRKQGIEDEERKLKKDLIMSLAKGEGVGMFGAKIPRINKVILHTGTGRPGKNVMGFEAQIDPEHIERLKTLAQSARDEQAARALSINTKGVDLPSKSAKNALADLATDFYPVFQEDPVNETLASGPPPHQIGAEMTGVGGLGVQPSDTAGLGIPPSGVGGGLSQPPGPGDIDLTQWAQQFAGEPQFPTPITNIHEIISQMGKGGGKQGNWAEKREAFFQDYRNATGRDPSASTLERFYGADEKVNPVQEALAEMLRERMTDKEPKTETKAEARPKTTPAAAPKARGGPRPSPEQDLTEIRRQFLRAHPNKTIAKITVEDGVVIITDTDGDVWDTNIKAG